MHKMKKEASKKIEVSDMMPAPNNFEVNNNGQYIYPNSTDKNILE